MGVLPRVHCNSLQCQSKLLGHFTVLFTLPMLVCKIWWVNCDKQHWEDEETLARSKKNSIQWKCPNYFYLRLCWRRNFKELWQMPRLSCYLFTDTVVGCWGVYSVFANVSTAVNWVFFFSVQYWKNKKNWVYSIAFKCRTDRVTRAHVYFCVKFMGFPYWGLFECAISRWNVWWIKKASSSNKDCKQYSQRGKFFKLIARSWRQL